MCVTSLEKNFSSRYMVLALCDTIARTELGTYCAKAVYLSGCSWACFVGEALEVKDIGWKSPQVVFPPALHCFLICSDLLLRLLRRLLLRSRSWVSSSSKLLLEGRRLRVGRLSSKHSSSRFFGNDLLRCSWGVSMGLEELLLLWWGRVGLQISIVRSWALRRGGPAEWRIGSIRIVGEGYPAGGHVLPVAGRRVVVGEGQRAKWKSSGEHEMGRCRAAAARESPHLVLLQRTTAQTE